MKHDFERSKTCHRRLSVNAFPGDEALLRRLRYWYRYRNLATVFIDLMRISLWPLSQLFISDNGWRNRHLLFTSNLISSPPLTNMTLQTTKLQVIPWPKRQPASINQRLRMILNLKNDLNVVVMEMYSSVVLCSKNDSVQKAIGYFWTTRFALRPAEVTKSSTLE